MLLNEHALDLKQAEGLQFEGLKQLTLSGRERGNSLLKNQFDQCAEPSTKYIW